MTAFAKIKRLPKRLQKAAPERGSTAHIGDPSKVIGAFVRNLEKLSAKAQSAKN